LENIFRLTYLGRKSYGLLLIGLIIMLFSCSALKKSRAPESTDASIVAEKEYDPLADPRDRTILEKSGSDSSLIPETPREDFNWASVDSFMQAQYPEDSNLTIYRIQLFASQYYTEANYELQIAQEVFSDSVFLKYELPYYKVLLGNATDEFEGRRLLARARALGYANSWLIESSPDSIYYRVLFLADSVTASDSLNRAPEPETEK